MAGVSKHVGFFVSYGEEEFLLDRDIQRFRARTGYRVVLLDGSEVSESELLEELYSKGFDERPKLVILDNAQKFKGGKLFKQYTQDAPEGSVLCAIVRDSKLSAVWSDVAKKGEVTEHKKFKTYENRNEVLPWMCSEARLLGVKLEESVAKDIFQAVGNNLYRLSNELRKLSSLVGKGGTITREVCQQVLTMTAIAEPWEVAEWAADKRPQRALNGISTLYKNGADDPAVAITYSLMKQVERLLVARTLLDKGATDEDLAIRFGMNVWRCKNSLIPMAKKHSVASLTQMMQRLCTLDIQMKTSGPSKRTQLELAVLAFAS